jgi:uncharacterized DUF497 family protein
VAEYRDDHFEWDEAKSAERLRRSGFDFHAARRVFDSDRYVERFDEGHSGEEDRCIVTGTLNGEFVSVVYTVRGSRKRILSAFEADDEDIADFMVTYAIDE